MIGSETHWCKSLNSGIHAPETRLHFKKQLKIAIKIIRKTQGKEIDDEDIQIPCDVFLMVPLKWVTGKREENERGRREDSATIN